MTKEVMRYTIQAAFTGSVAGPTEIVLSSDYAALEQECERLRNQKGDPVGSFDKHMEYMKRCAVLESQLAVEAAATDQCARKLDAALLQLEALRELLKEWRRMFDGGICSGSLGTLCDKTDVSLQAKP